MRIQIGPCCLAQDKIFFWILSLRTRHPGLIWIKTKEYLNGGHFGIRWIGRAACVPSTRTRGRVDRGNRHLSRWWCGALSLKPVLPVGQQMEEFFPLAKGITRIPLFSFSPKWPVYRWTICFMMEDPCSVDGMQYRTIKRKLLTHFSDQW